MTSLPQNPSPKRLGLVIDLDTCVGCHACATNCKEWNSGGISAPLTDVNAYRAEQRGVWFNRVFSYEASGGSCEARTVHFPKNCLHCEKPDCVTVCPTGASYKRAEDGIVLIDHDKCIGCKLCAWACPYGARELDEIEGVMKKCTLCVDKIYNDKPARGGSRAGLRLDLPDERAPFRRFQRSQLHRVAPDARARRLRSDAGNAAISRRANICRRASENPRRRSSNPSRDGANAFLRWIDRVLSR